MLSCIGLSLVRWLLQKFNLIKKIDTVHELYVIGITLIG